MPLRNSARTYRYAETTLENMLAVPPEYRPRLVTYTAAMDNYEPVPRAMESGQLVEYDEPDEISGQPRYMRSLKDSRIPGQSVLIIDDGKTARAYHGGGVHEGKPSPVYPEGCEPHEILYPFPVNPDRKRGPDGRVIDYANWYLGPRKAYLLKIRRG